MNTAISTPLISALVESIANGLSHDRLGSTECAPALPAATLTSATTEKSTSVTISAPSRPTCVRADSSMPITQIAVMIAIQTTPTSVTASVESAALCQPTSRNEYRPAICARLAMTMTSQTTTAQPPIQPTDGPSARVAHENVVPQSGSARLR